MRRVHAAVALAVSACLALSGALLAMAAAGAALRAVQWFWPLPSFLLVGCAFAAGTAGAYFVHPLARWLDGLEVLK